MATEIDVKRLIAEAIARAMGLAEANPKSAGPLYRAVAEMTAQLVQLEEGAVLAKLRLP